MKKQLNTLLVILGICVMFSSQSAAGTYLAGAKYWHTSWESAVLDWFEKDIALSFKNNRLQLTASKGAGDGYLCGPMMGYQTDDGKWSFSFSPMVFSSFDQDWTGSAGTMALDSSVNLERIDLDFAASYSLSKHIKLFGGYKYQKMEMDFVLAYQTAMGDMRYVYNVESIVHIPTVGVGGVYPFHDKLVAGLQLGVLYSIPDLKVYEPGGGEEDIRPWPALGYNLEGAINYRPSDNVVLQLGYRYQVFKLEARGPGRMDVTESFDVTSGFSVAVFYVF